MPLRRHALDTAFPGRHICADSKSRDQLRWYGEGDLSQRNRAVEALPVGRASCRVGTTPVKLAVHPIPGVSLRYWHPLTESSTVFVIDDDADVCTSIEDLLEEAGFRAISFEKAEDFLRDARFEGPGCIILDVSLPGISGLDFQQQLRKAGVRTPIIFLTAHGDIPMTVTALKSGAVEFFTKPID